MEPELGSPLTPIFLHPLARKREMLFQNPGVAHQNPNRNWNPSFWDWDSVGFSAKPSPNSHLESQEVHELTNEAESKKDVEEEAQNLTLKLGGTAYSTEELRPIKRIRSGLVGSFLSCQVDDCKADLSNTKDYHRRHKVCEHHSKASKAVVGKQIQRFCQQCSRFHLLSEFDERKRSCRRRLAGHNRRRRKNQPVDVFTHLSSTQEQTNIENGKLGLVKTFAQLADSQCNRDRDQYVQIVSKTKSLSGTNSMLKLQEEAVPYWNSTQISKQAFMEELLKASDNLTFSSKKDLIISLSEGLGISAADSLAVLLQLSGDSGRDDKSMMTCAKSSDDFKCCQPMQLFPVEVVEKTSTFHPNSESCKSQIHEIDSCLSLQLFSSDDNCVLKSNYPEKYFTSESSNPTTDTSPPSSPPVINSFLPFNLETGNQKCEIISVSDNVNGTANGVESHMLREPLDLFKDSTGNSHNAAIQDRPYPAGCTSSSGSDQSPSTSNSDAQEQTGHIVFKLFDKDPSNFPGTLRAEILSWLSNRPSEMESYIRPGCVVLSIYLSMLTKHWEELEKEFPYRVSSLVHSKSGFWASTRFLVRANRRVVSHRDGKIRVWRTLTSPELISVSPVAIVSGQETTLVLRGHNLGFPGTRIHCTYKGGYTSKDVIGSTYTGTICDNSISQNLKVQVNPPDFSGRCFIEVENGFKGNSFPVIIANFTICQELRLIEAEFEGETQLKDAVHFLNELGWLFQKKNESSSYFHACFSIPRFKFLFIFSVERDWLVLTKTLLDMLVEKSFEEDGLMQEFVEMLSDAQLLSRAVKRKCRKMVDLLLHYNVQHSISDSKISLFPPNIFGTGRVTPLHLAAFMQNSEDMVDALTSDPQEIGLSCWSLLKDENGYSPFMYASMRNNHSYNSLVSRKLEDRKQQISIVVDPQKSELRSCSQCAVQRTRKLGRITKNQGILRNPFAYPLLLITAVCVCVCLFYRGAPQIENPKIGFLVPFKWESLEFGPK